MTTNASSPLDDVTCCRSIVEYREAVEGRDVPFRRGDTLDGRFRITEVLSISGMGCIFKAEDIQNGSALVAVKVPHLHYESDPGFFSRFQREERIGLELNHPFILRFIPVPGQKSRPYIVTEYLSGCTLDHLLQATRPLPEKDALKIGSRLCEALQYLHDHGIIHRDLKPQNVMICRDRTIRIMDFGIARDDRSRRITHVGNTPTMGTPDYMAPEQVKGKRVDKRTDIYNLGALLYEMLTGAVPFPNENPWAALNARVTGDPVALRKVNPDLSPQAEEIVLHALQRNPADRYSSARAMKAELDSVEQVRVTGLCDRLREPAAWKPGLLERPLVLAAALLSPLAVGILVMLFLLLHRHPGQ
jgi:serine/threonine-protein kinase